MIAKFQVIWDNGHATGVLFGTLDNENDAEAFGADWHREMVSLDEDPEAAEEIYSYEVVEIEQPEDDETS
jgi:hypothetical protein